MFAAGIEIKTPTMHVEAAIRVILGRGFNSLRLHSTRRARSGRITSAGAGAASFRLGMGEAVPVIEILISSCGG